MSTNETTGQLLPKLPYRSYRNCVFEIKSENLICINSVIRNDIERPNKNHSHNKFNP